MLLRNPFSLLLIFTFLRLWLAHSSSSSHCAASLAWAKGPKALLYDASSPRLPGWVTLVSRGTFATVEFQGQEVLSLQDTLHPGTRESIRWCQHKNYTLQANSYKCTYKNQNFFLVHKWCISEEICLVILRLLRAFFTRRSTSKSGTGKDYLSHLRSSVTSTFKCLIKDSSLWCGIICTNLKKPKVQYDREKGALSNQPRLMRVTTTALLGS